MQSLKQTIAALLTLIVGLTLCGVPEMAHAQQPAPTSRAQTTQNPAPANDDGVEEIPPAETPTPAQIPSPSGSSADPSQGPLQPLPPAPESQQPPTTTTPATSQPRGMPEAPQVPMANAPEPQKPAGEPVGTAAAERTPTAGGAASKPAGNAIAPAKQRQVRSLVIKLGALAAGAVALGTVMALSRSTPSVPPGTAKTGLRH